MLVVVGLMAAVVGLMAAAACGDGAAPDPQGAWELEEGTGVTLVPGHRITLEVEGEEIQGRAACNLYGGTMQLDDDSVTIGPLDQTAMECEPDVMDAERAYLDLLTGAETIAVDDDELVLTGAEGELRFALLPPVPEADLYDTTWTLETLIDGETSSSTSGDAATLTLGADGTISGSTGCRTLTGAYVVQGDEIIVTSMSADGSCPSDGMWRQDGHVVEVLGDGFRAEVDGDRLTLTSTGDLGLVYRAG